MIVARALVGVVAGRAIRAVLRVDAIACAGVALTGLALFVAVVRDADALTVLRIADVESAEVAVIRARLHVAEAESTELACRIGHARPEERIGAR